ncbi:uncharacterized protein EI90DRAFT_3153049 [Cantharellus anzutake]|uniref:uncharacterized protein n=1 Tax=Cantharellus anzutake TaxID=1750568 RepID=UPI00190413AE|nr:uncharacterized protein EI90DRAFT_3153049 [Cantharellus anzutake]KAF8335474.1 hypothetical protein EI90DRAFT_3153049 [Cantharellus anzutake]
MSSQPFDSLDAQSLILAQTVLAAIPLIVIVLNSPHIYSATTFLSSYSGPMRQKKQTPMIPFDLWFSGLLGTSILFDVVWLVKTHDQNGFIKFLTIINMLLKIPTALATMNTLRSRGGSLSSFAPGNFASQTVWTMPGGFGAGGSRDGYQTVEDDLEEARNVSPVAKPSPSPSPAHQPQNPPGGYHTLSGQDHFLGGSPLNRLSWLRNNPEFLHSALGSPKTKWVVFNDGQPLVNVTKNPGTGRDVNSLVYHSTERVQPLLGPPPYFAQGKNAGDTLPPELITTEHNGAGKFLEAARIHGPLILFLGTLEPKDSTAPPTDPGKAEKLQGEPYFALDVTRISQDVLQEAFNLVYSADEAVRTIFGEPRDTGLSLKKFDAAIFSAARTMLDWNARNKYCTSCGSPVYSLWAGWKLSCSSLLPWENNEGRSPCPTGKGLHNTMHPRTDAVVITAVLDESGEKILLGRNKRFPPGFYSTLAGFLEPSESFEDAVVREIWEESGLHVHSVRYHSCQPWVTFYTSYCATALNHSLQPFPANLMVGCFALADSSQTIRTDLDNELEDARWFTREEVLEILGKGASLRPSELGKMGEGIDNVLAPSVKPSTVLQTAQGNVEPQDKPPTRSRSRSRSRSRERGNVRIRVPRQTAIAGVLIHKFAHCQLDGLGFSFKGKANL